MNKALSVLLVLPAILFVVTGVRWLVDPAGSAPQLGLALDQHSVTMDEETVCQFFVGFACGDFMAGFQRELKTHQPRQRKNSTPNRPFIPLHFFKRRHLT